MALVFSLTSVTAFAFPKGTHLVGGTGEYHKGGKCVAVAGKGTAKAADKKADVKKHKKHGKKNAEAAK